MISKPVPSTDIDEGGPAFPRPFSASADWHAPPQSGMTLRDYFAARSLEYNLLLIAKDAEYDEIAAQAYALADAMIAERDRKP
jgi:hypothetical protein